VRRVSRYAAVWECGTRGCVHKVRARGVVSADDAERELALGDPAQA